ncbi:MAG TPA: DUF362 domain-containing protein [Pyrinomonadaceae bacterium]|nr:DUF362 domain-containing protein [Pyrinomonadaceae bacterium]
MIYRINRISNSTVAAVDAGVTNYAQLQADTIAKALDRLSQLLAWGDGERGPLGSVIEPGSRVVIKPNWVMHENGGPWGMAPLVTHQSLVQAATEAALQAGAGEVVVGDAPIQGCDFALLLRNTELDQWAERVQSGEPRFKGIRDFRRTVATFVDGVRIANENVQSEDHFVLFNLAGESLLEPITDENASFRVTCYDPRLMAKTHAPGCHRYLIAREILEADVIVNLPKLKTHQKAGITCSLKNLIGINGNKEYLPHHRIGGFDLGGDCYPGGSDLKRALEFIHDRQNITKSHAGGRMWRTAATQIYRLLRLKGDRYGIEGSWSGNDTIWRTCLDLNRILLYGTPEGTMSDEVQRRVIHITDAIVAGQGNGPLSPEPLPMGLVLAGENAAAVDWLGAHLLGYPPLNIPIVREAFGTFRWPLTAFSSEEIRLLGDLGEGVAGKVLQGRPSGPINHPAGWQDVALSTDYTDNRRNLRMS